MREAMLRVVMAIPYGQVRSYGEVARLAGYPRHARMVGRALAGCAVGVPWHRVVNARMQISARGVDGSDDLQRLLLEEEGWRFVNGRLKLR